MEVKIAVIKSTLPTGVRTLLGWISKGTLRLDADIQRAVGQWNNLQQSLLVHSILAEFPVPPLYFQKYKDGKGNTCYSCLEGKQRLSTLAAFCSDEGFALNSATPEVVVDDTVYDLANMHFNELSEECKDAVLGFRFTIYCIEDATDEEIAEIFTRLNNSTPLTKIQQCRGILGSEFSKWLREIHEKPFFTQALSLSAVQARREAPLEILLQSMLILDARHEGYEWKGISAADVTKYCNHIRGSYNEDKMDMICEIADYLGEAFDSRHKWLKKSNVPMVFVLAKCALEQGIDPSDFRGFIDRFSSSENADYAEGMGSGNIKRGKTEIRLIAIASAFEDYMGIDDCKILSTIGVDEASAEPAEPEVSEPVEDENTDLNTEEQSPLEETPAEDENCFDETSVEEESSEEENSGEEISGEESEAAYA